MTLMRILHYWDGEQWIPLQPLGTIGRSGIAEGAVTTSRLADDAVTEAKLADDSVTTDKILNGTITTADLGFDVATQVELDAHINDTSDAHDASAVSVVDAGAYFTGTDVETVLQELGDAVGLEWSVLTNGNASSPELVFAAGDVIMVTS